MNTLGKRVKHLRELNNLTQIQLAKKANFSQATIAKIERDVIQNTRNITDLAVALHTTPEYLIYGDDNKSSILIVRGKDVTKIKDYESHPALNIFVPILPLDMVGKKINVKKLKEEKKIEVIALEPPGSRDTFCVIMEGDSMLASRSSINDIYPGTKLFFDPNIKIHKNKIVIAKLPQFKQPIIRQYIEEGGEFFLKAYNSQFPIISAKDATIFGTLYCKKVDC